MIDSLISVIYKGCYYPKGIIYENTAIKLINGANMIA